MILSANTLRLIKPVEPFVERAVQNGKSYGLSVAGYDIRIEEELVLGSLEFALASSVERFNMPKNILGVVHDKSSWIREGLAVFNTVIEPGWRGYLTLELFNAGENAIHIQPGDPIAQVLFHYTDEETAGYGNGKYQDQEAGPQAVRYE